MTTLDNITLINTQSGFNSGRAFSLNQAANIDLLVQLDNSWEVEVHQNSKYIIARGKSIDKEDIFSISQVKVQQALDLIAVKYKVLLNTAINCHENHIIWWNDGKKQHLRILENTDLTGSFSGKISVNNGKNNLIRITDDYRKSFRYIRLAYLSFDLFDEYRNLYLALENYVDELSPKRSRSPKRSASPKPSESERNWLKRVIKAKCKNYVESNIDKIYDVRCSLFHGKNSSNQLSRFLLNKDDEQEVHQALIILKETLNELYIQNLGFPIYNISQTSSIRISQDLFQVFLNMLKDLTLRIVKSDLFDINDPDMSLVEKLPINTNYAPKYSKAETPALLATHAIDSITQPIQVNGFVAVQSNGEAAMHHNIEGALNISNVDILEIVLMLSARTIN